MINEDDDIRHVYDLYSGGQGDSVSTFIEQTNHDRSSHPHHQPTY